MNSPTAYWRIFLILSGLAILSPLALDTFLPGVDDAAISFKTSISNIMVSFGVLSVGVALGQIIYGPLSDRFGRKPVIVVGLICFVIASLLTALYEGSKRWFVIPKTLIAGARLTERQRNREYQYGYY